MKVFNGAIENGWVILLAAKQSKDAEVFSRSIQQIPFLQKLVVVESGSDVLAYLSGEESFADRAKFPFPNLIIVDCRVPLLSGLGVLCWLRSEPRFENLPVILFNDTFSLQQTETAARLRAACCPKGSTADELMEIITRSLRLALGSDHSVSGFDERPGRIREPQPRWTVTTHS